MQRFYFSETCKNIIEFLETSPIKEQYIEGPRQFMPLVQVIGINYNDPFFFADYISIIRKKYPDADLNICEGDTDFCHMAARSGEPENWIKACHEHKVRSADYPNLFVEFNRGGAYEAALYMLKNAEYFSIDENCIADAFYYLLIEDDFPIDDSSESIEFINYYLNELQDKVNLDIEKLIGEKDYEYKYPFFLCLGWKPYIAHLFVNKWMDKKVLEDEASWTFFAKHADEDDKECYLSILASLKTSDIQFNDAIMLAAFKQYDLTELIEAYQNG